MKYEEEYTNLSNGIRWGNQAMLLNTLNKNSDLDLTYKEGKLFILAVEDNNVKLVEPLLDYFNTNQLAKYTSGSTEYLLLKNKMRDILELAIEDVSLSEEMKEILSPYIDFEGSEHGTINDFLEDYQESHGVYLSHQIDTPPMRKSHSMDDIKNYSTKSHSTHEHSDEKAKDLELIKLKNDLGVGCDLYQENHESEIVGNFKDFHHSD